MNTIIKNDCAHSTMTFWPTRSDNVPPGKDKSITGRATEAWTNATCSGVPPSEIINQDAPTSWICQPKLADNPASQ